MPAKKPAELQAGETAPDAALVDQDGKKFQLSDYRGQRLVLYFYPKDDTSGCTTQACDFTAKLPDFTKLKAAVVGVSPDDSASHTKFIAKHQLKVRLASDPTQKVLEQYGVWQEKSMYGRTYMGVVRSTFLVGPDGKLEGAWYKVKADGHADFLLEQLRA
ncbi:MAG: thioredoxin-dependent thiol peroxidase [Halobacteriales archaeon]|nr:thioredoxin-dependent thiol peroxidase [Halobacteriales archaeon]